MNNYSISVYAYCDKGYDPMDILRELMKVYFNVECRYYPDDSHGGNGIREVIETLNYVAQGKDKYRMIITEDYASSKIIFSNNPNFEKKED